MNSTSATVAEKHDHVVGIDTHALTHTLTVIQAATGQLVDSADFPTTARGLHRTVTWVRRRCPGSVLAAVEGTASYGACVTTELGNRGITVAEVRPPARSARARDGKSDSIDSLAAARGVLAVPVADLTTPRATGARSTLGVLLAPLRLMDQQRTANRNFLTALLRCTPLGVDARRPLSQAQIAAVSQWHTRPTDSPLEAPLRPEARHRRHGPQRRTEGQRPATSGVHRAAGPRPARHARHRAGHRRHPRLRLLPPRPDPIRSRLCPPRRCRTQTRLVWQHHPIPPRPRRRPSTQPRTRHHRADPHELRR